MARLIDFPSKWEFINFAVEPRCSTWIDICYTLSPANPPCKYFCFHLVRRFSKVPAATSAHIDQTENNVARAISTGRVMIYQSAIYGAAISPISNELFLHPPLAVDGEIWLRSANESEIYNGISRASRWRSLIVTSFITSEAGRSPARKNMCVYVCMITKRKVNTSYLTSTVPA